MNETLFCNAHGLRLIMEYEGSPRLKARLCEGNSWELSYGVTYDLNGNPFNEASTCTLEESDALFRNALKITEKGVRDLVTVPLTSNQFSGLVAFTWNVGIENFSTSSVLRRVNENRMDDAAACFGMWIFATNGQGHKQAMRGLLRRRYAESCLFMSYDWEQACDIDAIALQKDPPDSLPGTDRVRYKTAFKDVLAVAQRYPLDADLVLSTPAPAVPQTLGNAGPPGTPPSPAPAVPAPSQKPAAAPSLGLPAGPATTKPVALAPSSSPVPAPVGGAIVTKVSLSPAEAPAQTQVAPPKPPPVLTPQPINPNALPTNADTSKNMADSTRMIGMVLVAIGSVIQVVTLRLGIGTAIGAVFFDLSRDPVVITLSVTVIVAALGWVTKRNGKKTFARGADQAHTALH